MNPLNPTHPSFFLLQFLPQFLQPRMIRLKLGGAGQSGLGGGDVPQLNQRACLVAMPHGKVRLELDRFAKSDEGLGVFLLLAQKISNYIPAAGNLLAKFIERKRGLPGLGVIEQGLPGQRRRPPGLGGFLLLGTSG